ncbi:MAG: adenylate/guanylate cyclase domain-containing protein, partial [Treponema sp.]|nr:adenylate/guanylate cyclase domain-containing protein [Treponema sp.]
MKRYKKGVTALVIVLCVFAGTALLRLAGAFDYFEYKAYDLRVNFFAGFSKPSDDIIVVLLDQDSIDWANAERGWPWPWPRKAYAELVDYMNQSGAKSVVFDVLFSEPSIYRNADQDKIIDTAIGRMEELRANFAAAAGARQEQASRRTQPAERGGETGFGAEGYREAMEALRGLSAYADDASFIEASKKYKRVVQAVFFSSQSGSAESWPSSLDKPFFDLENFDAILSGFSISEKWVGAQFPIPGLSEAAGAIGNVTSSIDSDGIIRRARLFTLFDGKAVPGLSAASLLVSGNGTEIRYNEKKRQIEWDDYTIPVDRNGESLLRFRGPLDRYIPYYLSDILKSAEAYAAGEEPIYYPEDFKDRHVLFGFYAPGLYDMFATPISSNYPGVGIHITMLDNILSGDFIREAPLWADWLLLIGVIVVITLLAVFSGKLLFSVGGTIIALAGIAAGTFAAYSGGHWLSMVAPLFGALAAFLACTVYSYATEGSQKRFIKNAFSRYLSPIYIEQLVANPDKLSLGGERREISIFFSDVQGFTTISEHLDPDQLKELLNEYLTFLTNIIQNSGGTIDKYEGDAIIAFWNAPLNLEDHASRALSAALECQKQLAEKAPYFEEKFKSWNIDDPRINKRLLTRIGLNTGYAVVGNFGSEKHFNYTMLGDSVNLAARLEGLNKQFGTFLMCTDNTFTEAGKHSRFYGR